MRYSSSYSSNSLSVVSGRTVAHDPHDLLRHFFHKCLTWSYKDTAIAFDSVMFILDNLETLCEETSILSNHFPNIFKVRV